MDIEFLHQDKTSARFVISGTDVSFVNSLRRAVISLVATPAIDNVTIYENSSNLFDEFVAHRIGLIPIDARELAAGEKVGFVLDEEGPKIVVSGDLKGPEGIKPVSSNIPIITLEEGQRIRLDGEVVWGVGKTHAKFQPALASFKQYPVLAKKEANPRAVDACPPKALKIQGKELIIDPIKCNMCDECTRATNNAVEVRGSDEKFIFYVESFGNKDVMDVLHDSLDALDALCDELVEKI